MKKNLVPLNWTSLRSYFAAGKPMYLLFAEWFIVTLGLSILWPYLPAEGKAGTIIGASVWMMVRGYIAVFLWAWK